MSCPYLAAAADVEATDDALHTCTEVVRRLYAELDSDEPRRATALFSDHAVFETPSRSFEGIRAIAGFLAEKDDAAHATMHALTDEEGRRVREDVVEISALVVTHRTDAPRWDVESTEAVRHVLRRFGDRWLIGARVTAGVSA